MSIDIFSHWAQWLSFFLSHCLYCRQQMQRPLGVPLYCLLEETASIISLNKAATVGESSSGEQFFPPCNF